MTVKSITYDGTGRSIEEILIHWGTLRRPTSGAQPVDELICFDYEDHEPIPYTLDSAGPFTQEQPFGRIWFRDIENDLKIELVVGSVVNFEGRKIWVT